jgi:putative ABC transport system substrate-binding protein
MGRQTEALVDRRAFIGTLAGGFLAAPLAAEAQQATVYRVGMLRQDSPPAPGSQPLILTRALRDLGYIEGRNIVFYQRWAHGKNERFPSLAAELVALRPDAIVAETTLGTIAAMRATATIPIVMVNVTDPVGSGLVASIARPGGNVTGVSLLATEAGVKGVELLHAVVPKATRMAVLMSENPAHPLSLKAIQDAARLIGLTVLSTVVRSPEELEGAFASITKKNAGALMVLGGAPLGSTPEQREKLVELAAKTQLPTIYTHRMFVSRGGLLSYGPNSVESWTLVATFIDKILRGAKPGDIPVQQPKEFDLAINLKTAKALGLTIPPSLLQRADQVIE